MSGNYDKNKHDIGILRQDGQTKIGLMLAKKNGAPVYAEYDDEFLASQFFTGTPGYANLPVEKELAIRQDDWRSGMGEDVMGDDNLRYFRSRGMDLRFKGMAVPGTIVSTLPDTSNAGTPANGVTMCPGIDYNGNHYIARGQYLCKLETNGIALNYVATFPSNITSMEPFTDSNLYVGTGLATNAWFMDTSENFGDLGVKGEFFKTVHSSSPTLWRNGSANQIYSTLAPLNINAWSGATTVGSSYHAITKLDSKSGQLYIAKEDMPYYLDSTGAVKNDLAPELASVTSSSSGKNMTTWNANIYYPAGTQILLEIASDGTLTYINPARSSNNLPDYKGRVQALGSDEEYLYAVVDNGANVEILAGRWEVIDTVRWVWHPIQEIALTNCQTGWVSSTVQKRLYISSTLANEQISYMPLYTGYGDVTTDANRKFATNVDFETPYLHANFKDTKKAAIKLDTPLGHPYNANRYFSAYYKTLENTSYTFIGNCTGNANTMLDTKFVPINPVPTSTMFRLKFVANTDDTNYAPILKGYNLQAILYPPRRKLIACTIRCATDITLRDGTKDVDILDTITNTLNESRDATFPVTFYDIDAETRYVKFIPLPNGTPRFQITKDEKGREKERWYNCLLQEITMS